MTKKFGIGPNTGKTKTIYTGIAPDGSKLRGGAFFSDAPDIAQMYTYPLRIGAKINWRVGGIRRAGDEWKPTSSEGRWIDCWRLVPGELDLNEWTLIERRDDYEGFKHNRHPIELHGRTLNDRCRWIAALTKRGTSEFLRRRDSTNKYGHIKHGPVRTFATAAAAGKAALEAWTDELAIG